MSRAEDLLPPDERARLQECAREPLHVPGAVQPHGALLVVDPSTRRVLQASTTCARVLGADAHELSGRPLDDVLGAATAQRLHDAMEAAADGVASAVRARVGERELDLIAHLAPQQVGDLLVVEAEPSEPVAADRLLADLHAAVERLTGSADVAGLRATAVQQVRRLTGFDRVMIYHFHPDGHGEVVAEDVAEGLAPYLGLHYPASDIPAQARRLYLQQASRFILVGEEDAAPLVPALDPRSGAPVDLGRAQLRSVSRHHLDFMRNMGLASSMSLPMVHDGELIGMLSCGHGRPRHLPHLLRRACEVVAQQLTSQLTAMVENQRLRRRLELQEVRAQLVEQMVAADDVAAGLLERDVTALQLLPADSAVVRLEERSSATAAAPPPGQVEAAVERLRADGALEAPFISDALAADRPDVAELLPAVAGMVLVPFAGGADYLAWFRGEVVQSVDWLGDQGEGNRSGPLSPRNSFALWRQTVTGRCAPWDAEEVAEAVELRRDLDAVLLHRAEARLAHLGLHDALTGLPNRRLLMDRLEHALARHARGVPVSLLFIDLDRFKLVNDSLGHDVGDALIVHAAQRISSAVRAADTVARLGGDEFMVLCEDTEPSAAELLADRIVAAFQDPVGVAGRELRITASVGVTAARDHASPADLLREADTAMYLSKETGRNRASRFEAGLRYQALRRLDTEQALRRGFETGELSLHYQPVVDLPGGRLRGVEALLRWERPGYGFVPPDEFVPLAEDTGFIVPLGDWVLDEALRQLRAWKDAGLVPPGFTVAVNLSPRQLTDDGLFDAVEQAVARHGVQPQELHLEITETALMSERSAMTDAVAALAAFGASLAIDDFGTGYSSLAHLRYLPVHELKVDRTFISGAAPGNRDTALVAAVVGLAHEFGLTCVAEGVESAAQLRLLTSLGCDCAQGYHIARPMPAADLAEHWRARLEAAEPRVRT